MSNRTVEAQKRILLLLLESEMGVNAVQKQTSSDKKFADDVLKNLRIGNLIQQSKTEKHKQKKIQSLTPLGINLAQVLSFVNQYKDVSKSLHEKIKSFPDISFADRKNKKGILLAKGWTLEETKRYILYVGDSNRLGFYVERYVNELVMYRYAYINQKFDLNKVGKEIVYNIISSILNEYVQSILKYFKGLKLSYFLQYLNMYYDVEKQIERYNNRFIAPEISKFKGLIDTLLKTKFTESDATASHTAVKEELKNTESS